MMDEKLLLICEPILAFFGGKYNGWKSSHPKGSITTSVQQLQQYLFEQNTLTPNQKYFKLINNV